MTTGDKAVIAFVFILAILSAIKFLLSAFTPSSTDTTAIVWFHNKKVGEFPLQDSRLISLSPEIQLMIKNRSIRVAKINCQHKTCLHQGYINTPGRVICCVPNKLLIEITTIKPEQIDAITY